MMNIAELLTANAAVQLVVTAAEVAATLGVSKITLHRWEKDGYLTPVRIGGGLVRYKRKDVQQIARQA